MKAEQYLPCLQWMRGYNRSILLQDAIAALIVTVLLVPQSLAYALLAGLPPEMGLYASILPLLAYALFGTSRSLSVGPVAVIALMTAAAIQGLGIEDPAEYQMAAILLALLSGIMLTLLGLLRFGFLANFLSHPVVAGFITASAIIIALAQWQHMLGIPASGNNVPALLYSLWQGLPSLNPITLAIGLVCLSLLLLSRNWLPRMLTRAGLQPQHAGLLAKTMPMLMVLASILSVRYLSLDQYGVDLIGTIPSGLPQLTLPAFEPAFWGRLMSSAFLIALIGYVESIAVGRTLGAKRRQKINPDQELVGLGIANCTSALSGGMPVTGGFSRSVVNFDAGAQTQAAGMMTAAGIALVAIFLTGSLAWLPQATLAATIIVAVISLVDFSIIAGTWRYSLSDFTAVILTMAVTLILGIELGVLCGVLTAITLHLFKTSKPHMAVIGNVAGTEHYRNIERHTVTTHPWILSLRVDESLYFANAAFLEEQVFQQIADRQQLRHVVLMCSAVNEIDISALEVLENINSQLAELAIGFHLSEIKGPVMDSVKRSEFLQHLNGRVFMTHHQAIETLISEEERVSSAITSSHKEP